MRCLTMINYCKLSYVWMKYKLFSMVWTKMIHQHTGRRIRSVFTYVLLSRRRSPQIYSRRHRIMRSCGKHIFTTWIPTQIWYKIQRDHARIYQVRLSRTWQKVCMIQQHSLLHQAVCLSNSPVPAIRQKTNFSMCSLIGVFHKSQAKKSLQNIVRGRAWLWLYFAFRCLSGKLEPNPSFEISLRNKGLYISNTYQTSVTKI